MLSPYFNRELDKTAIIFEFLGKSFRNLEKLFLDRPLPLRLHQQYDRVTEKPTKEDTNLKFHKVTRA